MNPLAIIRPDAWELPLFVHVLGALVLIGALALTAAFLFGAWRSGSPANLRLALRSLAFGAIPGYVVLRGSAEWIADKEGYADLDETPAWIDIGYITAESSLLLILIAIVLAWRGSRRAGADGATGATRASAILVALLLLLSVVALWAMTTKPA